ncbi:hypothetical protein E4T80_11950 [Muribacter muris]|uniref:AntA/AntB antirepressor domain-containing protein n=1 Tax=Muribacter muris TaxID=67855 RepID=A0A4Y9JQ49_9PAST|nr:antA/AntB antirepressor family protein [Muribacter muris]MBF0786174.1 antA/AntB antirepressor family protein [Muribacter muris]MBF0828295.1 antA/AntB antirepressor family protein [Muribacter muris]TFV07698.1 hypothetical protein E4T80_11950 [Muribacter muris]
MTNSNLITVFNGSISNQIVQLANARDLHSFLESNQDFSNWISNRISEYGFIQDEDYIIVTERTKGRPRKEYHITLDMGKELGMVERNEKGRQIRKYFIACEKRLKELQNPQPNLPLADEPKFSFEQTQAQWLRFASTWYALYNCVELLAKLDKPLHALGSHYAPQVCGHATEYKITLGVMHRLLVPMFEQFEVDPLDDPHYYKALNTLRNYKPQGLGAIVRV